MKQPVKAIGILWLTLFAFMLTGNIQNACAQKMAPELIASRMTEALDKSLDLTEKQRKEVMEINLELAIKEEKLKENDSIDFWDKRDEYKAIKEDRHNRLKKVFNKEQYKKYYALNNRKQSDNLK